MTLALEVARTSLRGVDCRAAWIHNEVKWSPEGGLAPSLLIRHSEGAQGPKGQRHLAPTPAKHIYIPSGNGRTTGNEPE